MSNERKKLFFHSWRWPPQAKFPDISVYFALFFCSQCKRLSQMEAQSMTVSAVLNRLGKNQKTVDQFLVNHMFDFTGGFSRLLAG